VAVSVVVVVLVAVVPRTTRRNVDHPVLFSQNRCSACETISGPSSSRNTFGGPPLVANTFVSSSTRRSPVIERSTGFRNDSRVCSSAIEAILMALPSMVESNWKSTAHTTFGASATIEGTEEVPARLRGLHAHLQTLLGPQRWIFFLLTSRRSSWRSAAEARRNPWEGVWWRRRAARPSSRRPDRLESAPGAGSGRWSVPAQRLCAPTDPTCST
jgi:hypothetical protein